MLFKMCLIGCGGIAISNHGPSYVKYRQEHPDFITAACCDVDIGKAEAFRARFGFNNAYADMHAMIKAEKPDALCVMVSEAYTMRVVTELLPYGIPLLTEKPPGKDSTQTRALIEAAAHSGVPHMVAYNRRFLPLNTLCREWIADRGGNVNYIHYDLFRYNRDDADFSDTAVHAIDAVRYLTGADYAYVGLTRHENGGVNAKDVYLRALMDNGGAAHIHICPMSGAVVERAVIHCGGSVFELRMPIWGSGCDGDGSLTEYRDGVIQRTVGGAELVDSNEVFVTNGFYNENVFFFNAVKNGTPMGPTFKDALQTSIVKELYAAHAYGCDMTDVSIR